MKKTTKIILISSLCFMGTGALLTGAGMAAGGWPGFVITHDGIHSYSTWPEAHQLDKTKLDAFSGIDIALSSEADIEFLPSEDNACYLEYYLDGNYGTPSWEVSDGTLRLSQKDGAIIQGLYFFSPGNTSAPSRPFVRLYVPEQMAFSDIHIYNDYGNLNMDQISSETLELRLDYGDLDMTGCRFGDAEIFTGSGDIKMNHTEADSLILENSYGDSTLKNVTAATADLTASDGDLYLEISGLETLSGVNEYGDTTFVLDNPISAFTFDLLTEYGEISLPGNASGRLISDDSDEMSYTCDGDSQQKIQFTAESGDIFLRTK
ncbi:DUF4097 family beta strand repeat-containing protein [Clostridium sp. Marseille-P3244]|uniref:DUF4097 family beta strand repeat-containing protein n=1 Tax=Clostridium sp. Marseille-P3244 TaxID=1871020 RepID=UPI00093099B5|nr:DUF4097 family beta strand repeat-containing protein [Clostridium sp. Marseille-P3244]